MLGNGKWDMLEDLWSFSIMVSLGVCFRELNDVLAGKVETLMQLMFLMLSELWNIKEGIVLECQKSKYN